MYETDKSEWFSHERVTWRGELMLLLKYNKEVGYDKRGVLVER